MHNTSTLTDSKSSPASGELTAPQSKPFPNVSLKWTANPLSKLDSCPACTQTPLCLILLSFLLSHLLDNFCFTTKKEIFPPTPSKGPTHLQLAHPQISYMYLCVCVYVCVHPRSNLGLYKFLWPVGAPTPVPPKQISQTPADLMASCAQISSDFWHGFLLLWGSTKLSPWLGRAWPVVLNSQCQQLFVTSAPDDSLPGLLCSLATRTHMRHHQDSCGLALPKPWQGLPKG